MYPHPFGVNEENIVLYNPLLPYGANRLAMETSLMFNSKTALKSLIVRVPIIYGKNFKKNIIYDLLFDNEIFKINMDAQLQIYFAGNLRRYIDIALEHKLRFLNLATEPISAKDIALALDKPVDLNDYRMSYPFRYDMHTKHADLFGKEGNYLQSKQEIIDELIRFKFQILNGNS